MQVPDIRISISQGSVALRWPGDPAWYRVDHAVVSDDTPRPELATRDRFHVGPRAWNDTPDEDWIDPYAEIKRLRAENQQLRQQLTNTGMAEAAPEDP